MAGDASLPPVGQEGRLHVAGRSVPVEVVDQVRDSLTLDVTEDGWSLTDGEARLVFTGSEGAAIVAGAMRVQADGMLFFTPGALTRDPDADAGDVEEAEEVIEQRGRGETADVGQRRETFRVDILLDVVVLDEGRELAGQTLNVSPTGCLLRGDVRPLVDTVVVVRIPIDERTLPLKAQVIRVENERYALHFRDMDATQERALSGLIAKRQREILRRR
jgi:hypothetical protein